VAAARYVVHATLNEVARVTKALKVLMPVRLSQEDSYAVELGIAEVLTNIVLHGYAARVNGYITVCWKEQPSRLSVEIVDQGLPIPPHLLAQETSHAFNFNPHDVAQLPERGFGLALAKTVFDSVDYESINGENRLCLQRCLPK